MQKTEKKNLIEYHKSLLSLPQIEKGNNLKLVTNVIKSTSISPIIRKNSKTGKAPICFECERVFGCLKAQKVIRLKHSDELYMCACINGKKVIRLTKPDELYMDTTKPLDESCKSFKHWLSEWEPLWIL